MGTSLEPVFTPKRDPKRYTAGLRLWHWTNALVLSGSLITVLINSTLLDRGSAQSLTAGPEANPLVTPESAGEIVHTLEDRVWDVHVYFGYTLAVLAVWRLILEFTLPAERRLWPRIRRYFREYRSARTNSSRHDLVVKTLYLAFYAVLGIMVVTGLLLAFRSDLGLPRNVAHNIKEIHGFCMYIVLAFIVIHVAGVFLAERGDDKGIVSDMIGGGKQA